MIRSILSKPWTGWVLIIASMLAVPFVGMSNYGLSTAITALMLVALAVAYDLVVGRLGALSFAQPAFFGVGAYIAALVATTTGIGFWGELGATVVGGVVASIVIGIPSFRLSLHSFAIGTLAFAVIAQMIAQNWISVTGGPLCVTGIPRAAIPMLIGEEFRVQTLTQQYYLIGALAAFAIIVSLILRSSHLGLATQAVRDDAVLADAQGIWPLRIRLIIFAISAVLSACAGLFSAHFQGVVCPDSMAMTLTTTLLIMVFVGGRGSLRGVVLGAVIFSIVPQLLSAAEEWRLVIYSAILLSVVIVTPNGLEPLLAKLEAILRRKVSNNGAKGIRDTVPSGARAAVIPLNVARFSNQGGNLEVHGLTKSFGGVRAVDGVSFSVRPGELVGLIGPNGSGKSTSLDCISGVQRPDSGRITLDGRSIYGLSPHHLAKSGLIRTFQSTKVFGTLSVEQNLRLAMLGRRKTTQEVSRYLSRSGMNRDERLHIESLIEMFGLSHVRTQEAAHLSYGQRKLVQFASSLVVKPKVLLLDEPMGGVNPTVGQTLRSWIEALRKQGISIILVEHNMELVTSICDRLVVLDHGQKIADEVPTKVVTMHNVQEAYFGR